MTLQEIIPSLKEAKTVDEILTAEVQALYRAEPDAVRRASIGGELREIAKKNKITKSFNAALSALDTSIKEAERAAAKEQSQSVSIESVATALERYIFSIQDPYIQQIFALRYVEGLSWLNVSLRLGGVNTPENLRTIARRCLKKTG